MQPIHDHIAIPLHTNQMSLLDVAVSLNGSSSRFHVDTGASQTCIDRKHMDHFPLIETNLDYMATGLGGDQKVSKVTIDQFMIGKHGIGQFDVHVIDLSAVNMAAAQLGAEPIDGVLGNDFLRKYHAIIDYRNEMLYIKLD